MAKAKSKGSNSAGAAAYEAYVRFSGPKTSIGTLVDYNKDTLTFKTRKSGSQKMLTRVVPTNKVIYFAGTKGSAECTLVEMVDDLTPFSTGKRTRPVNTSAPKPFGEHLMEGSSQDYDVLLFNRKYTSAHLEEDGEGGGGRGRKKASTPAKSKKEKSEKPAKEKKDW